MLLLLLWLLLLLLLVAHLSGDAEDLGEHVVVLGQVSHGLVGIADLEL